MQQIKTGVLVSFIILSHIFAKIIKKEMENAKEKCELKYSHYLCIKVH